MRIPIEAILATTACISVSYHSESEYAAHAFKSSRDSRIEFTSNIKFLNIKKISELRKIFQIQLGYLEF